MRSAPGHGLVPQLIEVASEAWLKGVWRAAEGRVACDGGRRIRVERLEPGSVLILCSVWPPEDGHLDRRAAGEVVAKLDEQVHDGASSLRSGAVTRHAVACWVSKLPLPDHIQPMPAPLLLVQPSADPSRPSASPNRLISPF